MPILQTTPRARSVRNLFWLAIAISVIIAGAVAGIVKQTHRYMGDGYPQIPRGHGSGVGDVTNFS